MKGPIYCLAEKHPTNLRIIGNNYLQSGLEGFFGEYNKMAENLFGTPSEASSFGESVERMLRYANDVLMGGAVIGRAMEVELDEFEFLGGLIRPHISLEGTEGIRPLIESRVEELNGEIVYLDENFPRYTDFKKEDGSLIKKVSEIQVRREANWESEAQENPPIRRPSTEYQTPVAITGKNHFRNTGCGFLRRVVNKIKNRHVGDFGEKLKKLKYKPIIFRV